MNCLGRLMTFSCIPSAKSDPQSDVFKISLHEEYRYISKIEFISNNRMTTGFRQKLLTDESELDDIADNILTEWFIFSTVEDQWFPTRKLYEKLHKNVKNVTLNEFKKNIHNVFFLYKNGETIPTLENIIKKTVLYKKK